MISAHYPELIYFDTDPADERERKLDTAIKRRTQREQALRCGECGHVITHPDEGISMHGSHEHDCVNPMGVEYHIACFASAPGCAHHGEATLDWTWFPGFRWQLALCRQCQTHLGWRYRSADSSFYGLILERLRTASDAEE